MKSPDSANDPMISEARGFAAHNYLYVDLHIQEVLATLRYGIETRKGLIVLTGDAGSGKTTLLEKLCADLPPNVVYVTGCDPAASVSDVARLLLERLGGENTDDSGALLGQAKLALRARMEQRQIVALIIDDAHHMPTVTLAGLAQNFLAGSAEAPAHPLLQIVLSGRPELRRMLSHGALLPLRRHRPLVCELRPLSSSEVGSFIQQGLQSRRGSEDLFDERSVKRVALYAKGNPGAAKALCERSLRFRAHDGSVTPELVDRAARDLALSVSDHTPSERAAPRFDPPRPYEELFFEEASQSRINRGTDSRLTRPGDAEPDFLVYESQSNQKRRRSRGGRIFALTIAIAAVGVAIWSGRSLDQVQDWTQTFLLPAAKSSPSEPERLSKSSRTSTDASSIPVSGPDYPPAPPADRAIGDDEAAGPEPTGSDSELSAPPRPQPSKREQSTPASSIPAPRQPKNVENQNLETQVVKAIESRAIMGVEVSVVEGTAYLRGRVATERQRRAAEQAARSVAGVERVQNRIAISYG